MTKKQGLRAILFLICVIIMILFLFRTFRVYIADEDGKGYRQRYNSFYKEEKNTWDGVLIGSSSVDRGWAAPLAWNEYGITLYSLSTGQQPLILATDIMREVKSRQDIKLAVIDLRGIRSSKLSAIDGVLRNCLDNMKLSLNRIKAVNHVLDFYDRYYESLPADKRIEYDRNSMYIPFIKYHSRWKDGLTKDDFVKDVSSMKGTYANEELAFFSENLKEFRTTTETVELNEFQLEIMNEIFDYSRNENIELLFMISPCNSDLQGLKEMNAALELAKENGFHTLNFSSKEMFEELNIDFSTDYYNVNHFNSKGAAKFTEYLAKYIAENYELEDKRGNSRYSSWDEAYGNYVEFYQKGWAEVQNKQVD